MVLSLVALLQYVDIDHIRRLYCVVPVVSWRENAVCGVEAVITRVSKDWC